MNDEDVTPEQARALLQLGVGLHRFLAELAGYESATYGETHSTLSNRETGETRTFTILVFNEKTLPRIARDAIAKAHPELRMAYFDKDGNFSLIQ